MDPVGFAYQYLPYPEIYTSKEQLEPLLPILYDGFYTDEQCPVSYDALRAQYDEAYFSDHFLLCIVVKTENGVLPELARIDVGSPIVEVGHIVTYIDNIVESPEVPQMYRIFIELPRSYLDFEEGRFYSPVSAVTRRSPFENFWVWETAE